MNSSPNLVGVGLNLEEDDPNDQWNFESFTQSFVKIQALNSESSLNIITDSYVPSSYKQIKLTLTLLKQIQKSIKKFQPTLSFANLISNVNPILEAEDSVA